MSVCEAHGIEPDPRVDPGAAIGWIELHYGDLIPGWLGDPPGLFYRLPASRVCRRKRADGDSEGGEN